MNRLRALRIKNTRWIVLFLDMCLCVASVALTTLLFYFHQPIDQILAQSWLHLQVTVPLTLLVHLLIRPHSGIIRQTALYDLVKVFVSRAVVMSLGLVWIFELHQRGSLEFFYAILVVDFLMSTFLLITLRLFVKWSYGFFASEVAERPSALIYGVGDSGNVTYNALRTKFKVLAFVDDDKGKQGKRFHGKRVLSMDKAEAEFMVAGRLSVIILAIQGISTNRKREIAARCIANGIKLQLVPKLEDMLSQGVSMGNLRTFDLQELLGRDPIVLERKNVSNALFGKCILITGAAGSIGSEIGRQVLGFWPSKVIYLDQAETPLFHLEREIAAMGSFVGIPKVYALADICQTSVMRQLFVSHKIDMIFHAAAYKHVPLMEENPIQALSVNTWGSAQLSELAMEFGVSKFVQVSTDKAVNPTNVMGGSKRAAERYIQSLSTLGRTQFITTRFGNVLGSNGSVIPLFQEQLNQGGPLTVTHPDITRYFMTIPEACSLVLEAGAMGKGGEIYVFDMGTPVKIRDLAENMIRLRGLKPYLDVNILYTGLRPGEKLYEELLNDGETTRPTNHPKIMVAKVTENDPSFFQTEWRKLHQLIENGESANVLVSWLKKVVPEYISENSPYESIDQNNTTIKDPFSSVLQPLNVSSYANSQTKRWFDLVFTLSVLPVAGVLLLPLCLVYPIFGGWDLIFRHHRIGNGGRHFYLYKIRSLKRNHNNPRAGMVKGDGTTIPVLGKALRQSHLDELPQIWNILRGDMSWVGPRPEQIAFVEEFKEKYPTYDARHAVRPGITGLAQINNPDATLDDHQEKLIHDLVYIQTASLWLDIKILWKSVVVVFRHYI